MSLSFKYFINIIITLQRRKIDQYLLIATFLSYIQFGVTS